MQYLVQINLNFTFYNKSIMFFDISYILKSTVNLHSQFWLSNISNNVNTYKTSFFTCCICTMVNVLSKNNRTSVLYHIAGRFSPPIQSCIVYNHSEILCRSGELLRLAKRLPVLTSLFFQVTNIYW